MTAFIDDHGEAYGVESICKVLPIAPSKYCPHAARRADPAKAQARVQRAERLCADIQRVGNENRRVYEVRKAWRQLRRESVDVARCTVARLMRRLRLRGVIHSKGAKTTVSDTAAPCPLDQINRQFRAEHPNALRAADFTYVPTWQGHLYVAFVIDVYARCIAGWMVSSTMRTHFVLDALKQALQARRHFDEGGLIHYSDRGSQYVPIRHTERLAEAGIEASAGSVGDSPNNASAEPEAA